MTAIPKRLAVWTTGCVAAMLALAGTAQAQVAVTVVLKTGERITGENPNLAESGGFSLRTDSGEFRTTSTEVAHVDFSRDGKLPADVTGGPQAVVLRDGTVIVGKLIDMAHVMHDDESSDYVVRFSDGKGEIRRFLATEIARIYFSPPITVSR